MVYYPAPVEPGPMPGGNCGTPRQCCVKAGGTWIGGHCEWGGQRSASDLSKKRFAWEAEQNQTACGHLVLKDGVCFGPHLRLFGI